MPLLDPTAGTHSFPVVQIPGLPDFNEEGQETLVIEDFENWWDTAPPRAVLVPNGGGAGAIPSGDWLHTEAYLVLSGWVIAPPEDQEFWRQSLLVALPTTSTVQLNYLGRGWDVDKCIFVRRYDAPTFTKERHRIRFSIPLVAPDPNKYGFLPVSGGMSVDMGFDWYNSYTNVSGWGEEYASSGGWYKTYLQEAPSGPYGPSLSLTSDGSVTSYRVTTTVVGPLTAGDWKLEQELASGNRQMWAQVSLAAGQTLIIDSLTETATISGSTYPLFGDVFTLEPGTNTYRLISATPNNDAYALVSALPAYM
jgi:hypothetical protein